MNYFRIWPNMINVENDDREKNLLWKLQNSYKFFFFYLRSSFHIDTYQLDEERQAEVDRVGALAVDIFVNGQHEEFAKSVSVSTA